MENAGDSWASLQRAVDRVVAIIQADPNKERIDRVITRWIKRHLNRLSAEVNLEQLNSLIEDKDMLAENLENLVKKERLQGIEQGIQQGIQQGMQQGYQKAQAEVEAAEKRMIRTVINMLQAGLSDDQVVAIADITPEELKAIKAQQSQH